MNNRGSVAVMFAGSLVPLMMFVGLAFDTAQLWLLRQRVQWSLDASALLGASQLNYESTAQVQTDATALFWANFGSSAASGTVSKGFLGATATVSFPAGNTTSFAVTATATVPTIFMQGLPGYWKQSQVTVNSAASVPRNIEIALALDNSLSMDLALVNTSAQSKLAALKGAITTNLVPILFGGTAPSPYIYMSVVPFAGAVNVGAANTGFLDTSYSTSFPVISTLLNPDAGWRGCVMARSNGGDVTETAPNTAPFPPYFADTTYQKAVRPVALGGGYYPGDNDWTVTTSGSLPGISDTSSASQTSNTNNGSWGAGSTNAGPNLFCMHNSLTKLTNDPTVITTAIAAMTPVSGGGTILDQGLQWAWLTVSPLWAAQWALPAVPATGAPRPQAYNTPTLTKIVILMTDGLNEIDGVDSYYGRAASSGSWATTCNAATGKKAVYPECINPDSWYSAYGRVSNSQLVQPSPAAVNGPGANPLASTASAADNARATAVASLTDRWSKLCDNIKATGTQVYTIYYHGYIDDSLPNVSVPNARAGLSSCATDSAHFFESTNSAGINNAFTTIARNISSLKLSL